MSSIATIVNSPIDATPASRLRPVADGFPEPLLDELIEEASEYPKSVLGKAHLILEAFDGGTYRVKLSELSRRAGLPKPTTHRLAQELVQWGLLEKYGEWYELGMRVFDLGRRTPLSVILQDAARPHLVDLFAKTGLTAHLVIRSGDMAYFVDRIAGGGDRNSTTAAGQSLPLAATAAGKLFLAFHYSDADLIHWLEDNPLRRLTPRTIMSNDRLLSEIRAIRDAGFALDFEENTPGHSSIAVLVPGRDGQKRAVVTLTRRSTLIQISEVLPPLRDAATRIAMSVNGVSRVR
ncbi:IclR family transcriptional regulator [Microbacterium atlanticum]|uniref:IclR family transcriptional regulator n=1 Tax=Microbacterium atlanticum TaxID=2782168 RepID=UPI00188836F2|nr:IclR family transcriptional regulator [Microbacterium atlanticum]